MYTIVYTSYKYIFFVERERERHTFIAFLMGKITSSTAQGGGGSFKIGNL